LKGSLFDNNSRLAKTQVSELHTTITENIMAKEGWGRHGSIVVDSRADHNYALRAMSASSNAYLGAAAASSNIYNLRFGREVLYKLCLVYLS
jgi:hypothetical protein